MTNVRWAQGALLAVLLTACAHTSSSEDAAPQAAESDVVLAQGGEAPTYSRRIRPLFLAAGNSDLNTTYNVRQSVVATDPASSCRPWADDAKQRCDLSSLAEQSMR